MKSPSCKSCDTVSLVLKKVNIERKQSWLDTALATGELNLNFRWRIHFSMATLAIDTLKIQQDIIVELSKENTFETLH
jgi:hypothetical protein